LGVANVLPLSFLRKKGERKEKWDEGTGGKVIPSLVSSPSLSRFDKLSTSDFFLYLRSLHRSPRPVEAYPELSEEGDVMAETFVETVSLCRFLCRLGGHLNLFCWSVFYLKYFNIKK
jgi:hypothetical protein